MDMSADPEPKFPTGRLAWSSPNGKGHIHLKCGACGEAIVRDINLRELTIISCPKCKKPIFRGEPEK